MSKFIQITNIDASEILLEAGKMPLLFSDKDIKYNLNKFLEHKVPVLWITGMSGGGKTTLANKIADEANADLLSLDTIKHFINLMISYDDEVNEIVSKDDNFYLIQKLLKKDPDKYLEKPLHGKPYLELLCYLIKEVLKKHNNSNQIIIEGVQIADMFWFDKSFYNENSAIIIKGTSLATSFFRRLKRDQGRGGFINKFSDIGKILRLYKEWYDNQNEFRETITPNNESWSDEKSILAAMNETDREYAETSHSNIKHQYVYKENEQPVGFINLMEDTNNDPNGVYIAIGIHPKFRGKGIFKKLIDNACSWLNHQDKYKFILYYLNKTNTASLRAISKISAFKRQKAEYNKFIFRYDKIKNPVKESYSPPMSVSEIKKNYPTKASSLLKDPVHRWRAENGIELIHKEPTLDELNRIWNNWLLMSDEQKKISDEYSKKIFGKSNEAHFKELIKSYK